MRRKVTCTATTRTGEVAALLLAQLDLGALVLVGGPDGLADDVAGAAAPLRFEPRVHAGAWADAAGAELVVLDVADGDAAAEVAARCPGAVVIVATGDPVGDVERLLAATHLPRARIVGAPADDAGAITAAAVVAEIADAVLRDRGRPLRVAVQALADDGIGPAGVAVREARIGSGGVQEIL